MNDKTIVTDTKKASSATSKPAAAKKATKSAAPSSKEKTEKTDTQAKSATSKDFCEPSKFDLSMFDIGAVYTGVETLVKGANKLDKQVTNYAGDLHTRFSDYIKKSITSYKKNK